MLSFELLRCRITVSFWFSLFIAVFLVIEPENAVLGLGAAALHEAGHIAALSVCGIRPRKISLKLGAAEIKYNGALPVRAEFIAAFSGPAVNLALFALCGTFGFTDFSAVNLCAGVFNLLPIGASDGGRILNILLLRAGIPIKVVRGTVVAVGFIFSFAVFAAALFSAIMYKENLSLVFACAYLMSSCIAMSRVTE